MDSWDTMILQDILFIYARCGSGATLGIPSYSPMSARCPDGPNTESEITPLYVRTGIFPVVPAIEYSFNHSLVVYMLDAVESSNPCRAMLRIVYLIMLLKSDLPGK